MNEVYEYRRAPNPWVIRLFGIALVLLTTLVVLTQAHHLMSVIWGLTAVLVVCMLLPKPISGIRIDDDYLVLAAWRKPRPIPLDRIAYLLVTDVSAESRITIVYKDGQQEATFAGDMPDIDELSEVMAERGIPLRDNY
ncbi:hypothetical protein [Yoonia sp. SS1-5]|uniref:PH domain-containing protein n=1 Tax=Yoonia rhodophyticola TaxID=3137370 RepID=A0AAN0M8M9_9RHOB